MLGDVDQVRGKLRVLYIDDEQMMRDVFKQYVETVFGLEVETASSAKQGKSKLDLTIFDAVVSDYQMPEEDGIQLLRELRSEGNDMPFILFTGRGREEIVIEAINSGADYYIQKGGDPNAMFAELVYYIRISSRERRGKDELIKAKERLESFIENTLDAIILFNIDGSIISVNSAFEKTYGWSKEEATGLVLPMVPPEEVDGIKNIFRKVAETGIPVHYTARRLRRNGEMFDSSMTISAIKDHTGKTIAIAGLARDISIETRSLEIIEEQKEELRVILSSIGDAVIATDSERKVIFLNQAASALTGYSIDESVGMKVDDVFHIINEDTRKAVEIPVETVIRNGLIVGMANHTVIVSKDGRERMIEDSAAPIKNAGGKIIGVVMVFKDATADKLSLRRREARRRVSEILASSDSLERAMPAILEAITSSLKFQMGEIWWPDRGGKELGLSWRWSSVPVGNAGSLSDSRGTIFRKGDGLPGTVWESMRPKWIEYIPEDLVFARKEMVEAAGLRTVFGIPILNREESVGVLLLFSGTRQQPDANMINTVADIGKQIGLFVGKLATEKNLRTLLQNMQSFVKHTPLIVITSDLKGNILSVNDSFQATYGWSAEEVVGKNVDMLIPHRRLGDLGAKLKMVAEGTAVNYEATRVRKDGKLITMRVMLSPVKDDEGNVIQLTSICRDVTEEKMAEATQRLNNAVIENADEMVLIAEGGTKGELTPVYANPAYYSVTGLEPEELYRKNLWEMNGEMMDTGPVNRMFAAYSAGVPFHGELRHVTKKGDIRILDTTLFPMKEGDSTHWVQLQRDITELVEQREGLRRANEKLNLMETISRHDMLNHLHAIELYTQMIMKNNADNSISDKLERIKNITVQMRSQLRDLKDIQSSGNPKWMNVHATFERSISGMGGHKAAIRALGKNADIVADPLLDRVFYNLVDNSIRHGGSVSNISLEVKEDGERLLIIYRDDGKGVSEEKRKSIFSASADGPLHGLRLVSEILGITGIKIAEKGAEGKGACFEMIVPRECFRDAVRRIET